MSNPGDLIIAATLPELSFTATAIPNANAALQSALPALTFTAQAQQRCRGSARGYVSPARGVARSVAERWALGDRRGKPPHQHARARAPGPTNVAPRGC